MISEGKELTIAFAGRHNAGKTSLVMGLTNTTQRPVNFPGSTVHRTESTVTVDGQNLRAVDLPGIASLDALSRDESVTISYLRGEHGQEIDVLCVVMDASKLRVELSLYRELTSLGLPVVVALTKLDIAHGEGWDIDVAALSAALNVPVFATNPYTGEGIGELRNAVLAGSMHPSTPLAKDPSEIADQVMCSVKKSTRNLTERLDQLFLHRVLGLPLLLLIIYGVFQAVFIAAEPAMGWIETGQGMVSSWASSQLSEGALNSFVVDGLINGVGSVVIFLPQIVLLVFFITLMEATGYMARAAFVLDRIMRTFGLSGRSFVPMVTSVGCAIPGILATRTIEKERDRIATIVVSPLMSCSARLPVYVILIGAFFPVAYAGTVLFSMYMLGIVVAVLVALILRKTVLKGGVSSFLMELPHYQRPVWRVVGGQVWNACAGFVRMAGTIIFAASMVIWLLSYYPRCQVIHDAYEAKIETVEQSNSSDEEKEKAVLELQNRLRADQQQQSFLARAGKAIQPIFAPAGFDWRTTVGILAAFPARELIIPTWGVLYSMGDVDPGGYEPSLLGGEEFDRSSGLFGQLRDSRRADGSRAFSPLIALALMVFFALCSQCMATLAIIKQETNSWRWPVFTFTYMTVLAWACAVGVYQIGRMMGYS
ncbi:MAG: ferrous iron transport protein B [Myxococcales bacterium]|nr:ferrous iron transport protein B [Myxococcales bacterium]